jgi:hypothetical protein
VPSPPAEPAMNIDANGNSFVLVQALDPRQNCPVAEKDVAVVASCLYFCRHSRRDLFSTEVACTETNCLNKQSSLMESAMRGRKRLHSGTALLPKKN